MSADIEVGPEVDSVFTFAQFTDVAPLAGATEPETATASRLADVIPAASAALIFFDAIDMPLFELEPPFW
ncbi:MAG TPA: hypothetical protein VLS91_00015 [Acidimicrobiales bacterium]|nr:hypothetical protein [Acidimicrobiales bacterium]